MLLAWGLGAAEYILTKRAFEEPPCSKLLVAEWTQTDPALGWWEDQRLLPEALSATGEEPKKARISSADTYRDFQAWHWAEESKAPTLGQKAFIDRIKAQIGEAIRYIPGSNGFRGFEGLRLKEPTEVMKASPFYQYPPGSLGARTQGYYH